LRVPSANDVPAGHLWPPVNGRSVLAAVNEAAARPVEGSASWAPADSVEFRTNNGWILHTREAGLFSEQGTGREHLMRTIKRCLPAANFVPEGRALLLAPDENHWRLWMISPITPTLRQIIDSALGVNEVKTVSAALRDTALAAEVLAGAEAPAGVFLSPVLDSVSVANGRVVSFTLPGDAGAGSANEAPDVIEELKTVLLPAAGNQAAVGQCLRQAIRLVDSEPIRKLVTSIIEPILLADRAS